MPRILVVEDNEMSREMLVLRLERRGFQIIWAADGLAAVAKAESDLPDLIVLDMSLPALDGFEVTRRLKAAPATAAIPIIALTAHAMAGDRERCLAAGCDDYDTKPVDFARLLDTIRRHLAPAGNQ
ncbi:MAG TPA: response regulator [Chloroflexia bacterium]|nr:response regulator [Chloroflexia bacterium]